jgi:SET domain-containing protein
MTSAGERRAAGTRRTTVRRSTVHGRGLFAATDFAAGDVVTDYRGTVVDWEEASESWTPPEPGHTFLFDIGDGLVIDGGRRGNSARWLNHSCEPNCEAEVIGRRIVITALEDIPAGTELFLDYRLEVDPADAGAPEYACACGTPGCRRTMLAV